MSHSPGGIQAAGTLTGTGADTILTAHSDLTLDLHIDIVTAATISIAVVPKGGSSVTLAASKAYSAGDHVILSGIAVSDGDAVTVQSDQTDTTYVLFQSSAERPADFKVSNSSGAGKTNAGNQRVFATYLVNHTLAAAYNTTFFIATRALQVVAASCWFDITAGGTSTLDVIKDTGTTAVAGGSSILSAAFNLAATARTTQTGTLSATAADDVLAAGDRLSVKYGNAIQNTTVVAVTVEMIVL